MYSQERRTEGTVNGSGSGPVCMFIMRCSRLAKFKLKAPWPLPHRRITKKIKACKENQRAVFRVATKIPHTSHNVFPEY